ncbi:MAG: DUF4367 domain-containing protein [Clostridiales Family XIII bacterium]|jgi:hypothetical protein|nr:DUF4367 domain-containing protein [Clostridiales Family XIII bacterium]
MEPFSDQKEKYYKKLIKTMCEKLMHYASSRLPKSDAEDAVQEACCTGWLKIYEDSNAPLVVPAETAQEYYASLQDMLSTWGVENLVAPTYLPDGYSFTKIEVGNLPDKTILAMIYNNGKDDLVVLIVVFLQASRNQTATIEKNDDEPSIYTYRGVDHYLYKNMERVAVTWAEGMYDINIQGMITEEEMKSVINSMYSEE